jgi:plasmid stability protein
MGATASVDTVVGRLDCVVSNDHIECVDDGGDMATITIRKIDDTLKARLRVQAAHHGRSMEAEARHILRQALSEPPASANLADLAKALFGARGVELEPFPPVRIREPPDFGS